MTAELWEGSKRREDRRGNTFEVKYDGMQYLQWFRHMNERSYDAYLENARNAAAPATSSSSSSHPEDEPHIQQEGHELSHQQESASSSPQKS